ncbi:MAG TPA: BON domain-containing protein [Mycobacteriales bacterium]|nr:BON domain-containing protein [Mycobacteriales bacterium]
MGGNPTPEDPYYLQARIERRLAEDPDSAELGVRVAIHAGEVYLTGDVPSDERRRHVVAAALAAAGGRRVHDDLAVTCAEPPTTAEDLR